MKKNNSVNIRNMVLLAALTAITIILQFFGAFVRIGTFQIALVLVPIVVGAAIIGVLAGVWLGLVFGIVVLVNGDAALFLSLNPFGTVVAVLVKGMAAGLAAGFCYRLLANKNRYIAALCAAVAAPVVNTGIFILGCYIFFLPHLPGIADLIQGTENTSLNNTQIIFILLVGVNFLIELLVNVILSGVIVRIIDIWKQRQTVLNK